MSILQKEHAQDVFYKVEVLLHEKTGWLHMPNVQARIIKVLMAGEVY